MHELAKLYVELLIAIFLGLIFGLALDLIFRFPNEGEKPGATLGWLLLQIIVSGAVIMAIVILLQRFELFLFDIRVGVIAFTVFAMVFFTAQIQLVQRIDIIAAKLMEKVGIDENAQAFIIGNAVIK